jgi:hypothetical protein
MFYEFSASGQKVLKAEGQPWVINNLTNTK